MSKFKTKQGAFRSAWKLLSRLQLTINHNPKKFCENYGQKELRKFEDRLCDLHYTDKCDIMDILNHRVPLMKPE
jgi:hypothetical protein